MTYLPLNIVAHNMMKWITSCYTWAQLETCENNLQKIKEREDAKCHGVQDNNITRLEMIIQDRRLLLTLTNG